MSQTTAWNLLRWSVLQQSPSLQKYPQSRPLHEDEQRKVKNEFRDSVWDEGVITDFLGKPQTHQIAFDLTCGSTLLLFTQGAANESATVANETNRLLQWLGVPSGFCVFLVYREDPRWLRKNEWPTRRNVNGGWAVPGSNKVVVYRSEEWDRVLIHETIHAMRWDWNMPSKPLDCWGFDDHDKLSPHLFEAWTELYAEWLWCGWHNVPWEKQREWQDFQAMQILAREPENWNENTNIFAYYVLKAALAPHIAFLWTSGTNVSSTEQSYILCDLVSPRLHELRSKISQRVDFSLRMTVTDKK